MQAVILAAGQGTRIRAHHHKPKGFIPIDNKPLIAHSVSALQQHGITQIAVVTGYRSEEYEQLARETQWFETIYNPQYATFGSLYSLYSAKDWVHDDILILESDILYEPRALSLILNGAHDNSVLTSGFTEAGDEVYVSVNGEQCLQGLSKQKADFQQATLLGEFVGISRLSYVAFNQLIQHLDNASLLREQGHYEEQGLVTLAAQIPLYCLYCKDLQWGEIDTQQQWVRANQLYDTIKETY